MTLGGQLRKLREAKGLRQNEVASQAGISASYLCDLEFDRRTASADCLWGVARILGEDHDVLCLAAGILPPDLAEAVKRMDDDAVRRFARKAFAMAS